MSTNHAIGRRSLALLLLAGIMVAAATLLSYEINEPFIGHQDFNTAYMSTAAANHLRYGLGVTRFGLIMDNGPVAPANFVYYSDHPPLIPLIAAVSFAVFGEHAWSARLLPIAFSLGSVVLVYLLGRRLHGRTVGLVAAGIFGLLPMTGYFGRMLDHEAPTNFFVLASVLAYGHWRTSRSTTSFVAMVAALVAGALCGWPAYYLGLLLPLHHAATSRRSAFDRRILLLPALCLALFAVHILHTLALQGDQGVETLLSALRLRVSQSSSDDHQSDAFTWSAFATRHIWRLVLFYTWPTLLLTAAYVVSQFGGVRRIAVSDRLLVPLLFAFGMTHIALFPQGSWIHDYWMFYLSAPLSLAAAEGALFLSQWRRLKILAGAALFVFPLVAIPETIAIHNWNDFRHWKFYHLGRLLNAHTRPDEIILKSAGDAWWDLSAPQTLYYAQRSGVGREPILDLQALEALLQDRDSGPYAFVLFHRKVDAGYFDVAVDDESRAVRFEERLAGEYPMEELEYEGHAFRLYHIGRRD